MARPFSPPPDPPPNQQRPFLLWLVGGGVGLLLCTLVGFWAFSNTANSKEARAALANLKEIQRDWWDNEGLNDGPSKDPAASLEHLRQRQRDWWDSEGLARRGNREGSASLEHLEQMQSEWWEKEALASATSKDRTAALGRLDDINRQWWGREALVKLGPAKAEEDATEETTSSGDDPDAQVKLLDREGTQNFLKSGGNAESEAAVQAGLRWLERTQANDGHWVLDGRKDGNRGTANPQHIAATAMGLLPFLAKGETHRGSEKLHTFTKIVDNGVKFLLSKQKPDGSLSNNMYAHGLAAIALCEDLGMTNDPILREPCQKAVNFIVKAQDPKGGGWRYQPRTPGDMSVSSWQLMALKSGQMSGLSVPRETLEKAVQFLKSVATLNDDGYAYLPVPNRRNAPPPMTAAGMLCRQYLTSNADPASAAMKKGVERLLASPPSESQKNMYYYYYASQVIFNIGGEAWTQWNPKMRDLLIRTQVKDTRPEVNGSWDPAGEKWAGGGRMMVTSFSLLTLEVYYRHLPLNRPELGEMQKDIKTSKK